MKDPVVELVVNAIGYGVMLATEGRDELARKLSRLPTGGSLADALVDDAESFVKTRADLVDAIYEELK